MDLGTADLIVARWGRLGPERSAPKSVGTWVFNRDFPRRAGVGVRIGVVPATLCGALDFIRNL
jgi:hypothetical protein